MAQLLIIRHAIAMEREDFAPSERPDSERPLTDKGIRRMERAADGLHALVPSLHAIVSSPWTRARQTADIVAKRYPDAKRSENDVMIPSTSPESFAKWLAGELSSLPAHAVIAVVGHEPHLGELTEWLIDSDETIIYKKGGAALLQVERAPRQSAARLIWMRTPAELRGG
jgi:phosphohistidine phosphatase